MTVAKKELEKAFLSVLCDQLLSTSTEDWEESEQPDFLFTRDSSALGLEVVTLVPEPQTKRQESEFHMTIEAARRMHTESDLPPCLVWVTRSTRTRSWDRGMAASALTEIVRESMPGPGDEIDLHEGIGAGRSLPEPVESMMIARLRNGPTCWTPVDPGLVVEEFVDQLQATVDPKNQLYSTYLDKCSDCWLLVGVESHNTATAYEASAITLAHRFITCFPRLFLVQSMPPKAYELQRKGT